MRRPSPFHVAADVLETRQLLSATAVDDQFSVQYDPDTTALELAILANDLGVTSETVSLIDGTGAAVSVLTGAWGELEVRDNGVDPLAVLYDPADGYETTFSFDYQLSDGTNTTTASVELTVEGELAPLAIADAVTVVAGDAVSIDPLSNDSDPEGTPLTLISVSGGTAGTASLTRYIPPSLASEYQGYQYEYSTIDDYVNSYYGSWSDYFQYYGNLADDRMVVRYLSTDATFQGDEILSYVVEDAAGWQSTGTITVTVLANQAPVAANDTASVVAGESVFVDPLANDSDPEGTQLTLISVSSATAGTVAVTRYIPPALAAEYEMNDSEYATIDDFVDSWYMGWDYYFQNYGNPADNRMVVEYSSTDPNYSGTDTFTYVVEDAAGIQSTGTVTITVTANQAPSTVNDTVTVNAGEVVTLDPLTNDSDPEGTSLTLLSVTGAAEGTVAIVRYVPPSLQNEYQSSGGEYGSLDDYVEYSYGSWESYFQYYGNPADDRFVVQYTSTNPSFTGDDLFTYTVEDAAGLQSTGTVTVTVLGNQAPIAIADTVQVIAGGTVNFDPLVNDSDPEGSILKLLSAAGATHGTVALARVVSASLQSEFDYEAQYGYYTNIDDYVSAYYGGWDNYYQYYFYGDPADINRFELSYTSTDAQFSGDDTFTYVVEDAVGLQSTGTVTVQVQPNQAPVTTADSASVVAGDSVSIDPLANDNDPEGTSLTLLSVTGALEGTSVVTRYIPAALASEYQSYSYEYATIDDYVNSYYGGWDYYFQNYGNPADNRMVVKYTSTNSSFNGQEVLTYTVADADGIQNTGSITITVIGNQAPTAVDDSYSVLPGESVILNLLDNDSDPEGSTLSLVSISTPSGGVISQQPDVSQSIWDDWINNGQYYGYGSFEDYYNSYYNYDGNQPLQYQSVYTPNAGFSGDDFFTYVVADAFGVQSIGSVTVSVQANQAPIVVNDSYNILPGESVTLDLLANDSDPEGHALTIQSIDSPAGGTVSLDPDVSQSIWDDWINNGQYYGYSSFEDWYNSYYNYEGQQPLTYQYVYTPGTGFGGVDTFNYTVVDSQGATSTGSVTVNVAANQAPVTVDDTATVVAGDSVTIDPISNDSDPENGTLTLVSVSGATAGTATLVRYVPPALASEYESYSYEYATIDDYVNSYYGSWDYYFQNYGNPADNRFLVQYSSTNLGFSGTETLNYVVEDSQGTQSTGTITVTVQPNQAPVATNDDVIVNANESVTFDPLANDSDPEGTPLTLISISAGSAGTATLIRYIPPSLQSDYDMNGSGYATIDDFVDSWYMGWDYYFQNYGNPADDRMVVEYVRTNPTVAGTDSLTYVVADAAGNQSTGTINVTLLGDTPPSFDDPDYQFTLAENSADGASVGFVSATDPDPSQTLSYTITTGNEAGAFVIDSVTGEITVADFSLLDFEVTPSFELVVSATNTYGISATAIVAISLMNEDDPLQVPDVTWSLSELANSGDIVGTITVAQPNAGVTYGYDITSGNEAGNFDIDATTGVVTVSSTATLDYETLATHVLTITVTSSDNETVTSTTTVNLSDVNETPVLGVPEIQPVSKELTVGESIGIFSGSDPEGDGFSFQIDSQSLDGTFAIDPNTGDLYLANQAQLSGYEGETYQVSVVAIDSTSGNSSPPQTVEFDVVTGSAGNTESGIELESGYWVDPRGTFLLNQEDLITSTSFVQDTETIDETSEYTDSENGDLVTYVITGLHEWSLDTTTTMTSDGWTYSEIYISEVNTTSTGSDQSVSTSTATFGYTFTAYLDLDYAGYTLIIDGGNEIDGTLSETWSDTSDDGLLSGGSLLMSWGTEWADLITITSKTTLADDTLQVTTENEFHSKFYSQVNVGDGSYYYEVKGGKIEGVITSLDEISSSGSSTVVESKNAQGDWNWDSGISTIEGKTLNQSNYESLNGDYSFSEDGNTISGTIIESGETKHDASFKVTSHLQTDGEWIDASGEMSASGHVISNYEFTSSGTYSLDDSEEGSTPTYSENGSVVEFGNTSSELSYSGSAVISQDKWIGSASASGFSISGLTSILDGTFATKNDDGSDYSGTTKTTSTFSDNVSFNQSAILEDDNTDQSAWKWNQGTSKQEVTNTLNITSVGTADYSYEQGNSGSSSGSGSGSGSSSETGQTGTVTGSISDNSTYIEISKVTLFQYLDAESEWQVSSGSKNETLETSEESSFSGGGTYTTKIDENGVISGTISESGKSDSKFDESKSTLWDTTSQGWGDTSSTQTISGSSSSSYSSSGSGTYSQTSTEGTQQVKVTESSYFNDDLEYEMTAHSTISASSSGSGSSSSEGDGSQEVEWSSGFTKYSSSSSGAFTFDSNGSLDFGGQDGGISGSIITKAETKYSTLEYLHSEVQSDGSWLDVDGYKQTTTTSDSSSDFKGAGSFGDNGDISIGVTIETRSGDYQYDHERQEVLSPGVWGITEGTKESRVDSSNYTSYSGGGSIDSGALTINTTIDGKNDSSNDLTEIQNYNTSTGQWEFDTALSKKIITSSNKNNVEYDGGGTLGSGSMPMTIVIDGHNKTEDSHNESYQVDKAGTWTLDSGSETSTSDNAMNMTYNGSKTETVDDGTLFMNVTTTVTGGNNTSSFSSETRSVNNGEWGGTTGTESSTNGNQNNVTVHGQGTLNVNTNSTTLVGQVTLDVTNKQSFAQNESYSLNDGMRTPTAGSKVSTNSQSNKNTFFAVGPVDQGDLTIVITIDQYDETKSGSSESHTLVGDSSWAAAGGTFNQYSKHKDHFDYDGTGTTTTSLDSGDLTGSITTTIKVNGHDHTDETTTINGNIAADGTTTITNGLKINIYHIIGSTSTDATGSFSQPIDGGSISGTITQNSSTSSDSNEYTSSIATGNSWTTIGTKTITANGNSDYSSSADGSFSLTSTTGSNIVTTNTKNGTVEETTNGDSSYGHNESWIAQSDGSWTLETGTKWNEVNSKSHYNKDTTLGNFVYGSETTTENGTTVTTTVSHTGNGHEEIETKSTSNQRSDFTLNSEGNWGLTGGNQGATSYLLYDVSSSGSGNSTYSSQGETDSKNYGVETANSESFFYEADSWSSASFNGGDWSADGGKTVTQNTSSHTEYKLPDGATGGYGSSQVQDGKITKNEGSSDSSSTLVENYTFTQSSGSGGGAGGELTLTSGTKTSVGSGSSEMEWEGSGSSWNHTLQPFSYGGIQYTGYTDTKYSYNNDGYQTSSHDSNITTTYDSTTQTWNEDSNSYSESDSAYYNFTKRTSSMEFLALRDSQGIFSIINGSGSGTSYAVYYSSNETRSEAVNGQMKQVSGQKLEIISSSGTSSNSGSGTYLRGTSSASISGTQKTNENSAGSQDRIETTTWNAGKWETEVSGSFNSSSYQDYSYSGSASNTNDNPGSWTTDNSNGSEEKKYYHQSSGSDNSSETYFSSSSTSSSGSFGTRVDGSTFWDETRKSETKLQDHWNRSNTNFSTTKYEYSMMEYPSSSGSGSGSGGPGVLVPYYKQTDQYDWTQTIDYKVDTSSSSTTTITQDTDVSQDKKYDTTYGKLSGTANTTYYSKSNSGISSEYYEGGSITKTVDVQSHWINKYSTTDTYDQASVNGSNIGSTNSQSTETITANGSTSSSTSLTSYPDNDSYSSSGSGGGFHWQAYFHEINQNYRPGNPIAAPPKPNSQSHGNPGNEPSTYSNGFNAWVGENLIRPNFGDDFLANGSDAAIYGTLVASVSAGVLLGWYGGGAVFSSTTLLGATANGALWGGVEYAALGGILELGSGGLAPDMTLEGLATSVAFGGVFSGAGYLVMPMRGVANELGQFVGTTLDYVKRIRPDFNTQSVYIGSNFGSLRIKLVPKNAKEALEQGLSIKDPHWPWRGLHSVEGHHPLMQGKTFKQFWKERGLNPDEVDHWIVDLDTDIHRAITESGWWDDQILGRIEAQEKINGILSSDEVRKIAEDLLDEIAGWSN